jgi:hypothetical protein
VHTGTAGGLANAWAGASQRSVARVRAGPARPLGEADLQDRTDRARADAPIRLDQGPGVPDCKLVGLPAVVCMFTAPKQG